MNQILLKMAYKKLWLLTDVKRLMKVKLQTVLLNFPQILGQTWIFFPSSIKDLNDFLKAAETNSNEHLLQDKKLNKV